MTITYPINHPVGPYIGAMRLVPRAVVAVSKSPFTGTEQVQEHQGQWWEADIQLIPMKRAIAEEWISFLLKLNGRRGTFLLGDPTATTPRGVATGTPRFNVASQTGNTITTYGWTTDTQSIMCAGDYIQVGSDSTARLYKVLEATSSNSVGVATLTIWPSLRSSPNSGAGITVNSAQGLFRLAHNDMPWGVGQAQVYGIAFGAMEAL